MPLFENEIDNNISNTIINKFLGGDSHFVKTHHHIGEPTLIDLECVRGNLENVKFLVENGADIKSTNVLELAAQNNNLEVIKSLVESSANPRSYDNCAIK